ncbi:MAG: dihydrolipoyl dehydrogenase [Proteobacteria bacterium]|nr:dihydrolipoyl dehydrogenase [Pseudomonadota bacterium]
MPSTLKLLVPDLGDFSDVDVIEVLVKTGDQIDVEESVITLETDKASMDVPAAHAGKVISIQVAVGDKVSAGDLVLTLEAADRSEDGFEATMVISPAKQRALAAAASAAPGAAPRPASAATNSTELVVIGAGVGGYTAAFRAADLGLEVTLVERWPVLGGVCLNVGCIPSKALLHVAKFIDEAEAMAEHGVQFGRPRIDASALRAWKNKVVGRLTGGLIQLAKQRKVKVVHATAKFESANRLILDNGETIDFRQCIIAAGSESSPLPGTPEDPRIMDSTAALELDPLPKRMLVVGGGIIGLELACVYSALGTSVSVIEMTDALMPGTDPDLVRPFRKIIDKRYEKILLQTKATSMRTTVPGIEVRYDGKKESGTELYDRVLISIGRSANGNKLDAQKAGVEVDRRGIVAVNKQMRTNVPHIFAIGDLAGGPMLAHKAAHEAKVAAEVAAGEKSSFDARAIPSVAFTDPEIAWVGLTETDAKRDGIEYEKARFPWAASGRALSLGRDEGFTKLLFEKGTGRVLGGGIVGPNAGDLIAEVGLAIEMGADATDISRTIHQHPTLSETVAFAAEAYEGTLTDLYIPRKR